MSRARFDFIGDAEHLAEVDAEAHRRRATGLDRQVGVPWGPLRFEADLEPLFAPPPPRSPTTRLAIFSGVMVGVMGLLAIALETL